MSTLFWGAVFAHIFIVIYFHHHTFSGPLYLLSLIFITYKTVFQVHKNFKLICGVEREESEATTQKEKVKLDGTTAKDLHDKLKVKVQAIVQCFSGDVSYVDIDNANEKSLEWCSTPEGIFPTEIWTEIFANLHSIKDVTSCYNTCSLFRRLLEFRIKAEVLLLINSHLEKHRPHQNLQKQDLLNMRLVSHSWKLSIDHFLQHHPSHATLSGHRLLPSTIIDSNDTAHVEGLIERLVHSNFFKYGTITAINPFPSRHLWLTIHSDMLEGDQRIFYAAVMLLLKYFGTHLWYITIDTFLETNTSTLPLPYEKLCQILENAPSLRMAHVCFYETSKYTSPAPALQELTRGYDFPNIPFPKRLSALKFYGVRDALTSYAGNINKQIEKNDVSSSSLDDV